MSALALKHMRTLQGLADIMAMVLQAQLAMTTDDGRIVWVASSAATQTCPAPTYDTKTNHLLWYEVDGTAVIANHNVPLSLPEGQACTLWARSFGCALDLPTLAALFQQHLAALDRGQTEVDRLAAQLLDTYEEINLFYRLADAFNVAMDEAQLVEILLTHALEATQAHGGVVIFTDQGTPHVVQTVGELDALLTIRPLPYFPALDAVLQRGITRHLGAGQEQVERATLIVPLLAKQKPVGAIVLQQCPNAVFDASAMKLTRSLCTHAGMFLNNMRQAQRLVEAAQLQHQLAVAETVQRQLLPASDFKVPGMDIAAAYLASQRVGGDYYDVFALAPHLVGAVVADVSGHSVASGLLMTAARSALRLLMRHTAQPAEILRQLNETLYEDLDRTNLLLTVALALIDLEAHVIRYANAGHSPALLRAHVTGEVTSLKATGFVIGFDPDADFEEHTLLFTPEDALILYTDGVTEARSPQGKLFGEERLHAQVRESGQASAQDMVTSIMADVRRHAANRLVDDTTLLVLKRVAYR